jgi:hypothetical protein
MSHVRQHAPIAIVLVALFVCLAAFVARPASHAEAAEPAVESAVIAVTGEGSTARGWYQGASPPGVNLQDALELFAEKGYRIVEVTMPHRAETTEGQIWYILLEKTAR